MRIAIIGNNDGPRRLKDALSGTVHEVVYLGLQKPDVPDEATALRRLEPLTFDLLVNCFANFRYRELHHRYRAVNVHLAPLPAYRGRHPLQWALINGEAEFGVTIHDITDDYDAGAIRWQATLPVADGWSAPELREALMRRVETGFADFLNRFDPAAPGLPNDPGLATYVTRRYPYDSELRDWSDRESVYRKVNALRDDEHPAYVLREGKQQPLIAARRGSRTFAGAVAGTVVGRRAEEREVACGDGRTVFLQGPGLATLHLNDRLWKP